MPGAIIWGIHAGKTGNADSLFLKENVVAVGWPLVGDLSLLEKKRQSFKEAFAKKFPGKTSPAVANSAGQLFRFVTEMKKGDLVVYPSKQGRMIHIGTVQSDYRHDPKLDPAYPNVRDVEWVKEIPRTAFSQGALYEIGSAMSLFQVKAYAEEFRDALARNPTLAPARADTTIPNVVSDIEETTKDYILKTLAEEMKGHPFARFVANLLNTMGYRTRVAPEGPDGGIDIIAHRDELGFEPPIVKVQVKSSAANIGDPDVSAFYGKVMHGEYGLLITLGTFTNQAKTFARGKTNLRLVDQDEIIELILTHYEQIDSQYKATLPLKKVYVPQPPAEDGE